METQIISFETAKLAKEKGLVGYGHMYNSDGDIIPYYPPKGDPLEGYQDRDTYFAPIPSVVQKWLMEEYNIIVYFIPCWNDDDDSFYGFHFAICETDEDKSLVSSKYSIEMVYDTPEDALDSGLFEALKNL